MATKSNLRRTLDRKQWEMCNFSPVATTAGSFSAGSKLADQYLFCVTAQTTAYFYDPAEDGWLQLPSPALATAVAAGTCGATHPYGPRAFPSAGGTTSTIPTALNLARDLRGYRIRIIAGPNAGRELTIVSNTLGANAVITVEAQAAAFTTASEFILLTGRLWVISAASTAAGSFKYYDMATNTWANAAVAAPASMGTDAKLVSPCLGQDGNGDTIVYLSGTATAGSANTLTNAGKTWAVNTFANYQVRIVSGTGAGQFRTIASNTATVITVSANWAVAPDATSQYVIEGNEDHLYLAGGASVALYRFSLSAGTWTTLSPTVARAGAPSTGMSLIVIKRVDAPDWNGEGNFLNGTFIYSFRGGGTSILDCYDITQNKWSVINYGMQMETFNTGTCYEQVGGFIYIQKESTGRFFKFNVVRCCIEPFSLLWYPQSTALVGDRLNGVTYQDGDTKLEYLYFQTNNQQFIFRVLII